MGDAAPAVPGGDARAVRRRDFSEDFTMLRKLIEHAAEIEAGIMLVVVALLAAGA